MQRKRRLPSFLLVLAAFAAGVAAERAGWIGPPRAPRPPFPALAEAHRLVHEHFVDRARVRDDRLEQAAIRGLVRSLGDAGHTDYLSPEDVRQSAEDRAGKASGVGVRVALVDGQATVLEVFPGSPALEGGLRRGDVVRSIDDADAPPGALGWVTSRLRGVAGSAVRVGVERGGGRIEVPLTRADFRTIDVMAQRLPTEPPVGLLVLRQFHGGAADEALDAMTHLSEQPLAGLVLDLRGNLGGLKEQAVRTAALFVPDGTPVLIEKPAKGPEVIVRAEAAKRRWLDLPIVVLIDSQTASSSEVLAAALRDAGRATLVGTRTYGAGTLLREYPLPDGSALRLAVKTWKTPKGEPLWFRGLSPDVEAALPPDGRLLVPDPDRAWTPADLLNSGDAQLLKGLDALPRR